MNYLFGPVNSRRLGLSLGIDLLPAKICTFNCIYCEVGPTTVLTCDRKEYTPTKDIITEINSFLAGRHQRNAPIDVFTITASGEPTLHSGLKEIIKHLKKKTAQPVAVLTNGSLLYDQEVQSALHKADIVIPSLDAALQESYRKINRPAPCVRLEEIIEGLCHFSKAYKGHLWLEILIAKGINDSPDDILALHKAVTRIQPEKIQLNTVVRPPLEHFATPLSGNELESIARQLPGTVEIIADFSKRERKNTDSAQKTKILDMLQRRPCTQSDICEALNLDSASTDHLIKQLVKSGDITKMVHRNMSYYQT